MVCHGKTLCSVLFKEGAERNVSKAFAWDHMVKTGPHTSLLHGVINGKCLVQHYGIGLALKQTQGVLYTGPRCKHPVLKFAATKMFFHN